MAFSSKSIWWAVIIIPLFLYCYVNAEDSSASISSNNKMDVVNTAGTITSFDWTEGMSYSFRAQMVYFDAGPDSLTIPPYHHLSVNLMLPPVNYTDLCFLPSINTTQIELPMDFEYSPLALLVPWGRGGENEEDCSLLTKIRNALEIQRNWTTNNQLWSIIFYNNHEDEKNGNDYKATSIYPMTIDSEWKSVPGIDSLILATVSHAMGTMMLRQIDDLVETFSTTTPQHVLSEKNLEWQFPIKFERASSGPFRGSSNPARSTDSDDESTWGVYSFIWFRFALFAFIFCFPCFRFFRLWWAAGGRIRLRRNERGWIIGLIYQPPMENWFVNNGNANNQHNGDPSRSPKRNRLSKEQVIELPEISYEEPPEKYRSDEVIEGDRGCVDEGCDRESHIEMGSDDPEVHSNDYVDASDNAEDQASHHDGAHEASTDKSRLPSYEDVEESQDSTLPQDRKDETEILFTTTISTTCSICIDEFQYGEKIRLLPRCGHGFHLECILPWLTERQGCCPFCKTDVLDPSKKQDQNTGEVPTTHQANEREDNDVQLPL